MTKVLINAGALAELIAAGTGRVRLLDVRWQLGGPDGHTEFLAGHLPGAVFVDLDRELAAPPVPHQGRHPLPAIADLQESARRWGIHDGDTVVAYDNSGGMAAARAWWLLRWAGFSEVYLLDGGLAAWRRASGALAPGPAPDPDHGDVVLSAGALPTLTADETGQYARDGQVIDARAAERYRGETEPVDPIAGHIPGALSVPTAGNLAPDGTFLPAAELAGRFAGAGLSMDAPVGVYCGSGVTAAHAAAALAIAGYETVLYPGSWSQWSNLPGRPVATGSEPG